MTPATTSGWSDDDLRRLDAAVELEIAVERGDGSRRGWVPIWVVSTGGQVYVRTWHRRDTGWYGHALTSCRARVRAPGLEADVTIEDVGATSTDLAAKVDAAYRTKYTAGAGSMVTTEAASSTLRLDRT